jgi:ATP-dependent Clp protease ATP-binding subunit ClpA
MRAEENFIEYQELQATLLEMEAAIDNCDHATDMSAELTQIVAEHFRPEFVTRIDEIVVFNNLEKSQIKSIAALQVEILQSRLAKIDLRPGEKLFEELLISDNVSETEHPLIMRAEENFIEYQELQATLLEMEAEDKHISTFTHCPCLDD